MQFSKSRQSNSHIKQIVQKRRPHIAEDRQPNCRDENVTLVKCLDEQFQVHQNDDIVYHERTEAEEIRCVAFTEESRIFLPNVPSEEIDDRGMVRTDEHPRVEVAPAEQTITTDLTVE